MDTDTFNRLFEIATNLESAGLPPGVSAVTVGYKNVSGNETALPALVFFVDRKTERDLLHPSSVIPASIDGFPTDVVEHRVDLQYDPTDGYARHDPLVGGVSIKADWKSAIGTLGAVFCNRTTRQPMGLTNRHVVDNWTFNANGQTVFQPTERAENRIGTVWQHNKVWDCAAIAIHEGARRVDRESSFRGRRGRIVAIGRAQVNMPVFKVGAKTDYTEGVVKSSGPSLVVIHNRGGGRTPALSDAGDSGAVWSFETADGYTAVALHWGGSPGVASGKPMPEVARLLELDVLDR